MSTRRTTTWWAGLLVVLPGLVLGLMLGLLPTLPPATAGAAPPGPPVPPAPGPPVPRLARAWPVGTHPVVVRGWDPPATPYGRGHRGVDLAAPPGTPVRAVAAGRVSFAGRVAGRGVVSVTLAGTNLRTTYEPVTASVKEDAEVAAGEVVGVAEPAGGHCGGTCVHWGLLRGGTYLNPLDLLPPWLLRGGPSRLLPVLGVPALPWPRPPGPASAGVSPALPEEPSRRPHR